MESMVEYMMEQFFLESSKNGDTKVPDGIENVVNILESKGYQVKYASPGHMNTTFQNDRNRDKVVNGKLTTTARVVFSRNYNFPNTPKWWEWKALHNGVKALYVKPYTFNGTEGTEKEEFSRWKDNYLNTLETWAKALPKASDDDAKTKADKHFH